MMKLDSLLDKYFPCCFDRGSPFLVCIGILSALLYAGMTIWDQGELQRFAENVMIITFGISAWKHRHQLKSDLVFKLLFLAIVIPWILLGINALIDYDSAYKYKSINDLVKLLYFLPLAWWMGGTWKAARTFLIIAFLGLLMAIVLDPGLMQSLERLGAGLRVDFDIHNAQHAALFFGLVFLFSLIVLSQFTKESKFNGTQILLLFACLIGAIGLLGTQTRAAYLGILACGLIAITRLFRKGVKSFSGKSTITVILLLALSVGLLVGVFKDVRDGRFSTLSPDVEILLAGKLEQLPFSSVGIRIKSWIEAIEWIVQRPVTGWGAKARADVIQMSNRFPDNYKAIFGHLHNGYLAMLVSYGIVGLAFLFILLIVLLKRIKMAADTRLYAFACYGLVFFLVLNLFESLFFYWSGEFALALILAGGYSQYLASSLGQNGQHLDSNFDARPAVR